MDCGFQNLISPQIADIYHTLKVLYAGLQKIILQLRISKLKIHQLKLRFSKAEDNLISLQVKDFFNTALRAIKYKLFLRSKNSLYLICYFSFKYLLTKNIIIYYYLLFLIVHIGTTLSTSEIIFKLTTQQISVYNWNLM